jgi:hypothetical protein
LVLHLIRADGPDEIIAGEIAARQRAAQNKMLMDLSANSFDTGQSPEQIAQELSEEFSEPEA